MTSFDDGALLSALEKPTQSSYSIRAGREPFEFVTLLLLESPLVWTYHALLVLLVFGERSHQLVAE